jgi:osmotically-inducible protein OsmY
MSETSRARLVRLRALLLGACVALPGCAGVLVGGAATGAVVASDPRTTVTLVEDQAMELKALKLLAEDEELAEQARISVTSYNQAVLVTGQAPSEALRARAIAIVRTIPKVRHVHDEIAIGAPSSLATQTADGYLTTKVKTRLLGTEALNATRVKVGSEAGTVFLLGLVSPAQAALAAEVASETAGVVRVVKLFEYP